MTISRMYGAGGRSVGERLADELGFRLVDREIVEQAAIRAGIDPDVAEQLDERAPSLLESVGMALAAATPELGMAQPPVDDHVLARGIRRLVRSLAESGGYIIVGRGAQVVLRDHPRAIHLQLVAEIEDRARRITERQGIPEREAADRCRKVDADRAGYVRRFYGVDIRDPLLYDVVINTSRLSIDAAVRIAAAAARSGLDLASST